MGLTVAIQQTPKGFSMIKSNSSLVGLLLSCLVVGVDPVAGQQPMLPVLVRFKDQPKQIDAERIAGLGGMVTRQFQVVPAFAANLPAPAIKGPPRRPGGRSGRIGFGSDGPRLQ
jgi:hypothetical protein